MNELQLKSKGLQKVMQPRMAYKYAPRGEMSTSNLMNQQAVSQYAYSNRKASASGLSSRAMLIESNR